MYSWEVVCLDADEESDYDDCRAVTIIGKEVANNLREKQVDMVASQIANDNSAYHIVVDGRKIPLQAAKADSRMYVRTLDEDSPDDPLLDLPAVEEWKYDDKYRGL